MSIKREIDRITSATPTPAEDAKRAEELTNELRAILRRQDWPGVALSLCDVGGGVQCVGYTHVSPMDHAKTLITARNRGLQVLKAAKLLNEDD